MTKNQQKKALWGLLIGWLVILAFGIVLKAKAFLVMLPLIMVLAAFVWGWRTVDTLNEIKKSNKSKNDN